MAFCQDEKMTSKKKVKCHGCGREVEIMATDPEFMCSVCGAKNVVPHSELYDEPLACIPPKGFEWALPVGVLQSASGKKIYVTAQGSQVDKATFIRMYGCDPDITLANMRKLGVDGVEGYKNLSTLARRGGKK